MDVPQPLAAIVAWLLARPTHTKVLLSLATSVVVVELFFRRFAPKSRAYVRWTHVFEVVGAVWTVVILSVVYFVSVAAVGVMMKLTGKDPLDRALRVEPSFWRPHEPNPLGPFAAAKHQF